MRLRNIFLFFCLIILIIPARGFSQTFDYEIIDISIDNNKDTVFIHRYLGEWWIGAYGGVPFNLYFGKLNNYENPQIIPNYQSNKITFSSGSGWGYQLGLVGEWKKSENKWGAGLFLALINRKFSNTEKVPSGDTLNTNFQNYTYLNYLSFSPYLRYELDFFNGLYAFGGFDLDIPLTAKAELTKQFDNSEYIDEKYSFKYNSQNFRLGLQLGVGYEIFNANIFTTARANLTPYFTIHFGTNYLSDFGSSYNGVSFQLGISIKISPDKVRLDTHRFNPNYVEPPIYLASLTNEIGVTFSGFSKDEPFPAAYIAYIPEPVVIAEIPKQELPQEEKIANITPAPQRPSIRVRANDTLRFSYPSSSSTDLTQELIEYLDAVSEFLISNPGYRVVIEGHSDDRGTTTQNLDRSIRRSVEVMQYLLSKNIPRNRIITAGYGAVRPIVPNTTERNRAINRRVEIIILR